MKKVLFVWLVFSFGLSSCGTTTKQDNVPNMDLANELGIDSTQLRYQYYQKYGFTDVCEDIRMVSHQNESPGLNQSLPIDENDLKTINSFSNKVDKIGESSISFESNTRSTFADIEIDFIQFISDSTLTIQLNDGEYEIVQTELMSTLKIYDRESRLLYVEIHRCDGY